MRKHRVQKLLVILGPFPDRKLLNLKAIVRLVEAAPRVVRAFADGLDLPLKVAVPRLQGLHLLLGEPEPQVFDDRQRIVVRHVRAPTRPDTGGAVHEHHGDHRHVELRLDPLPVLVEVVKDRIVQGREHETRQRRHASVDVPRTRVVAAALNARAELAGGHEQVDVVGADKVLRHGYDGPRQRGLAMVVGAVLANVPDQLRNLHVGAQVPLEAAVEHLALCRLEAVHNRWDASHHAVLRELHQFEVHEVLVGE
mmetsp:Transcript_67951/g.196824  ORF Transcript_67951/g.196824 Transcript_67951/m.196824 type:complete len:253 (+) Transcript_67951:735-1493(+)